MKLSQAYAVSLFIAVFGSMLLLLVGCPESTLIDTTAPIFTVEPYEISVTPNSVTIGVTVNEASTLFWVLYENDGAPTSIDTTTLIGNAAGGIARSEDDGIAMIADEARTITMSDLSADTAYDFYAVARDSVGNATISRKLDITTSPIFDTTAPKFIDEDPSQTAATDSSVTIRITVDEASTLFWALYPDNTFTPVNADAFIANLLAGGGIARSEESGVAVTASASEMITISALDADTNYDFYAIAEDSAGNRRLSSNTHASTAAPAPDLVVKFPSASPNNIVIESMLNAILTLNVTVQNDGSGDAAETVTLTYYQSTDDTITVADTIVGTATAIEDGLTAHDSVAHNISFIAPPAAGMYYYGACVNTVSGEYAIENNCSSAVPVTVAISAFTLNDEDYFGASLANLGDLDGSGDAAIVLAVGAYRDDAGGDKRGTVHLLFLDESAAILSATEINDTSTLAGGGDAVALNNSDYFGISLVNLGDLDGSGGAATVLAVGATRDDAGGTNRGTVHLLFLDEGGAILTAMEINDTSILAGGGDAVALISNGNFGISLANLGDLDGTGDAETVLAVGANGEGKGTVHLFFLDESGAILSAMEINDASMLVGGGDAVALNDYDNFGISLANLGDLDGSGDAATVLAVGAILDDAGGTNRGAVHLLFLDESGAILSTMEINDTSMLVGGGDAITLSAEDYFGISLANLGDLDGTGDAAAALVIGAYLDDEGGFDRGTVHLLFLDESGAILTATEINDTSMLAGGEDAITLINNDYFGRALINLGKLNSADGVATTLAVGAHLDDAGGNKRGTVHLLSLDESGAIVTATEINDDSILKEH